MDSAFELSSSYAQFQVTISGAVFGPELRGIMRRYGQEHPVKVYAVVCEDSVPLDKRELAWVQGYQFGSLDPVTGAYVIRAYLSGIGPDAWKDGDMFLVRIYIPKDQDYDFTKVWAYDSIDALPKPLFLSEPIYVRCRKAAR